MEPTNPTFYGHQHLHQTSQYYSHFPSQNPNPYSLHQQHQLHIESHLIDPHPPGVDPYYSISHPYNAHYAGGLNYSGAADMVPHNWAPEVPVQQYGNTLYTVGATMPDDVSQQLLWTNPIPTVQPRVPWKKIPKKTKIVQSAWCEICKIECNTRDVLYKHKLGKKHIKNVEKLNSAASVATTSTTASNPIIGPLEPPKKGNSGTKKKAENPQDLETKRRRVLEGGAAADAVRTCEICNVVCNSDAVFRFHLAGQKHASMWKKSQQAAGAV